VTAITPDPKRLSELDDDTRHAWIAYQDRLRELTGEEYELAERESWDELQNELSRLEEDRKSLTGSAS
jgi:cell division septum initiation protein DivIVA